MIGSITSVSLETLDAKGNPPETRISKPEAAKQILTQFLYANSQRNSVQARLRGIVDGNQPYSPQTLQKNGQSYRTNINTREGEQYLNSASGNFYDIFAEVPHYATVVTKYGNDLSKRNEWSGIITEEFDRLQKSDESFDFVMQASQREMVLIGIGPVVFDDATNWKCRAISCSDLLVPDGTKSNTGDWKVCIIRTRLAVDELWDKIRDEESATKNGWNVEACKKAIMDAMPMPYRTGTQWNWEFVQGLLRDNCISYSARCDEVLASSILYKEFNGKISHRMIDERDSTVWLYSHLNRYEQWSSVVHPMYYDRGDGTHHGVKGMGIKILQILELKNRFFCAMIDASFARTQIMFRPTTPNAMNKAAVTQLGPYAIMPADFTVEQTNLAGVMDAPMAAMSSLDALAQGNTAQYRQSLGKASGNPRSATEVQAIVSQQSSLGKTQLNRYYEQLDELFKEKYRRATNLNLPPNINTDWDAALRFQKRCFDRGVPKQALLDIDFVQATRTVGQGSQFIKQQVLGSMLQISSMLPAIGQQNLLEDYTAAMVGQQMVRRYVPKAATDSSAQDQVALSMLEHSSIRLSNPVIVTDTQNHLLHVQTHMAAANEAASSLQQGGSQSDVLMFLQGVGQHVQEHLQRLSANPMQKSDVAENLQKLQELQMVIKQLQAHVVDQHKAAAQAQQAQAIQQGTDPKIQILAAQTQQQIARDNALAQAEILRKNQVAQANAQIKAGSAAAKANIQAAEAAAKIAGEHSADSGGG